MGILKGALSVRRYRVEGEAPEGFRDTWRDALDAHGFREPLSPVHKEETVGWVQAHNLLDTTFADLDRWLYNHYALFALRMDKKVLPAKLFAAHLQKRQEAWCKANNRERVPPPVKKELRELLEVEMLRQTLPRVTTTEVAWHIGEGWCIVHSGSERVNDTFRKLFFRTFGLVATPFDPIDFVGDLADVASRLAATGASDFRESVDVG